MSGRDFNDMAGEDGGEAVRAVIEAANPANSANPSQLQGFQSANSAANSLRTLPVQLPEDQEWDSLPGRPQASEALFHGVLGRLAKQAASGTEVNPAPVMLAAMGWASAAVGRNHVIAVGDAFQRPNLFTLHVGRSSRGGKGMALGLLRRVRAALSNHPEGAALRGGYHGGGLSSTEGLICLVHDGYTEGKTEHPPIDDKRLWVVESEFANALRQARRDGSTLSPTLRNAWDGQTLAPAVKHSRVWATHPHIALHGSITPTELRASMSGTDLSNGFANRFLMAFAERTCVNPFPARTADNVVEDFARELSEVLGPALAGYPESTQPTRLILSRTAAGLYADCYREFSRPHRSGELIAGLLQRRAPMLLRIALLLALMDGERSKIRREHIACAAAWMDYFAQSVEFVFASLTNAEAEAHLSEDAEKLRQWLTAKGDWQSRKAITRECFGGHLSKAGIDAAIERLIADGLIERREVDTGGTTKRTDYRVVPEATTRPRVRAEFAKGSRPEQPVVIESSQGSQSSPDGEVDSLCLPADGGAAAIADHDDDGETL